MSYQNDVIRSVLLHKRRANLSMMLARDYTLCHAARSTLVMFVPNNVQKLRWSAINLDLNTIDHLLDLLKRKVRAQPSRRELASVIHQMYAAIPPQYIQR